MQIPEPGDLVSIDKEVDAVIVNGKLGNGLPTSLKWALIKVMPGQNALVLESYNPAALSNKRVARAADEMLQAQQERMARKVSPKKRPPYNEVPKEIRILVLTIGNNIVEVVWDPDYMSVFNL